MSIVLIILILLFGAFTTAGPQQAESSQVEPVTVPVETQYTVMPSDYDDLVVIDSIGPAESGRTTDGMPVGLMFTNVSDQTLAQVGVTLSCVDATGMVTETMSPVYTDIRPGPVSDQTLTFQSASCSGVEAQVTLVDE